MFPLTHLACARAVLGKETTMTALGALFPDYCAFLGIPRNTGHCLSLDLYDFCLQEYPTEEALDFVRASLTHGTCLPGIDYYADEVYGGQGRGYCFQKGELIAAKVEKACKLPPSLAYWKAHNVIELAFDVLTVRRDPTVGKNIPALLDAVESDFPADFLAAYFRREPAEIYAMYRHVSEHFCFDGTDVALMADKFVGHIEHSFKRGRGDRAATADLILEACALIADDYDGFMSDCNAAISRALAPYR